MKKILFCFAISITFINFVVGQPNVAEPNMKLDSVQNAVEALFILQQSVVEADKYKGIKQSYVISDYKEILRKYNKVESLTSFDYIFSLEFHPAPLVNTNIVTYVGKYDVIRKQIMIYELERAYLVTPGSGTNGDGLMIGHVPNPSRYFKSFQIGFNLGSVSLSKMKVVQNSFSLVMQKNRDDDKWRRGEIDRIISMEKQKEEEALQEKLAWEAAALREKLAWEAAAPEREAAKKKYLEEVEQQQKQYKKDIASLEEGDMICAKNTGCLSGDDCLIVTAYVEKRSQSGKFQLRIAGSSSSTLNGRQYKEVDGVTYFIGDIIWVDLEERPGTQWIKCKNKK